MAINGTKIKAFFAKKKQERAHARAAASVRHKAAQEEYYRAKEKEEIKLARFRAEQERKKSEERLKFRPRSQQKPFSFKSIGLNVPAPRDMFGNLLHPQQKKFRGKKK